MRLSPLYEEGNFYKGNLHSHTTRSDGKLTPDESVAAFKAHGYDFLALTEHNRYTRFEQYNTKDFITIQGVEGDVYLKDGQWRVYHFIFLPTGERGFTPTKPMLSHDDVMDNPTLDTMDDIQAYIDDMRDRGYMTMINHPHWSTLEYDDILPLKNLFGVEILNFCSWYTENMGESNVLWDALLRRGMKIWGTATDDNHNWHPIDSQYCDSFGGYIQVKAKELSEQAICQAIWDGSFYASTGPEIYDYYVEDGIFHIKCSPVKRICVNGQTREYQAVIAKDESQPVTEYSVKLYDWQTYVRAECFGFDGRKAYTNPIYLK